MSPRRTDEGGFSLVEIIITIAIVGVVFAAILTGLLVSVTVSSLHRKQATADALARSAAEVVKDSARDPYTACATGYSLPGLSVPAGFDVAVTSVTYWDGANPTAPNTYSPNFLASCPSNSQCPPITFNGGKDCGMQLIEIRARSTDLQAVETVQVVKRVVYGTQG